MITGAGLITPLGMDWSTNARGFRSGHSAFRNVRGFNVTGRRVQTAAEVDIPNQMPRTRLTRRHLDRMDRAAKMLLLSAHQAWIQSGWLPGGQVPIVLGTTSGGMMLGQSYFAQGTGEPTNHRQQAARIVHYQAQRQGLDLADAFGIAGPITIVANACASGGNAIGHAWELIRYGLAERVISGGYEALSELVFAGFDSLQALSSTQCRPFDTERDGLALGEGAAVFALETLELAQRRRANVLAEIVGYGASTDIHHLTQPEPGGAAAFEAMTLACQSARLHPSQIQYVNAHGTGTVMNDGAETAALNRWAGNTASQLRVSSTKSSVGHLLGAAGAVEIAVCVMALQGQWIPPTCTLRQPEHTAQFQLVKSPADAFLEYVLSNSFGFGGANASLIIRRLT